MKIFWNLLGAIPLCICLGGVWPLLAGIVLIAGVASMIRSNAEAGLDESTRLVQVQLDREPDPAKARALCGLLAKMELHRVFIQRASMAISVGAAIVIADPIVPFAGWIAWMAAWRWRVRRQMRACA